jgi:hypothetical protein
MRGGSYFGAHGATVVIRAVLRYFPVGTAALGLVGYWYLYSHQLVDRPIRADGVSYYQYLPAWIADGDPTFETQARDCCFGYITELPIGIERWPETGRWLDAHPIGVAVLMLPFFLVAHGLSWWSNLPQDGFSLYYQYIVGFAGLAYVVAGLTILRRLLLQHFSEAVVLATLASITFGTNLFHYAVYDSTYSHAFSFFLVALLLVLVELWWEAATVWRSVALAVVAALIILVRHTNVVLLAFVPLYGISRLADFRTKLNRLQQRRDLILLMLAVGLVCLSPQLMLYKWATGHWIANAYGDGVSFNFGSPHILDTLFSVERGLFFWSPILLFSIGGLVVAKGWAREQAAATVTVLAAHTYLLASWYTWDYGAGFGHRGFTDVLAPFAVYVAAFFAWTARRPRLATLVRAVAVALVALSLVQTWQYWNGIIPSADTTWAQYRASFLRLR